MNVHFNHPKSWLRCPEPGCRRRHPLGSVLLAGINDCPGITKALDRSCPQPRGPTTLSVTWWRGSLPDAGGQGDRDHGGARGHTSGFAILSTSLTPRAVAEGTHHPHVPDKPVRHPRGCATSKARQQLRPAYRLPGHDSEHAPTATAASRGAARQQAAIEPAGCTRAMPCATHRKRHPSH